MNDKQLPKLTRKQKAFVDTLIAEPKLSALQVAKKTYNATTQSSAGSIAVENLQKPAILAHLVANSERAEQVVISLLDAEKDEVKLAASKDILDRVHGKATQRIEQTTTGVTLTIDLTSALATETPDIA